MQFSVGNASNATAEIAAADGLGTSIRLMTVGRVVEEDREPAGHQELSPQDELPLIQQRWTRASAQSIGGPWGSNFSAVCACCDYCRATVPCQHSILCTRYKLAGLHGRLVLWTRCSEAQRVPSRPGVSKLGWNNHRDMDVAGGAVRVQGRKGIQTGVQTSSTQPTPLQASR